MLKLCESWKGDQNTGEIFKFEHSNKLRKYTIFNQTVDIGLAMYFWVLTILPRLQMS